MRKMLIVEDEEDTARLVATYFEEDVGGFQVYKATGNRDAIQLIEKERPDILLLDMKLGPNVLHGTEGFEIIRAAKREHPQMKIVVVTGFIDPDMEQEAWQMGIDEYIEKPIEPAALWARVERVMEKK